MEPRGRNRLTGGGGNDRLDGRFGPDVFEGGSGIDTVTYAGRSAGVTATIDGVADDGDSAGPIGGDFDPGDGHRDDIGADIENVEGGAGNDVLRGDADANRLDAGPGDDTIFGGDGAGADDTLTGGPAVTGCSAAAAAASSWAATATTSSMAGPAPTSLRARRERPARGPWRAPITSAAVMDRMLRTTPRRRWRVSRRSRTALPDDGIAGEGDNIDPDVEGAIGGSDSDVLVGQRRRRRLRRR